MNGPEATGCDHNWRPLGLAFAGLGSAGYCTRCHDLRWLTKGDWDANRARLAARYREAAS